MKVCRSLMIDSLENISIPENIPHKLPQKKIETKKFRFHSPQPTRSNQTDERLISSKEKQTSSVTQTDDQ